MNRLKEREEAHSQLPMELRALKNDCLEQVQKIWHLLGTTEKMVVLVIAAENNCRKIVGHLCSSRRFAVDFQWTEILRHAIENWTNLEMIKILIANLNPILVDMFHIAVEAGRLDVVKLIVEQFSVDFEAPNKFGKNATSVSASCGHLKVLKYLVEDAGASFAEVDSKGENLLFGSCLRGKLECVKYLVEMGLDVNLTNLNDETPIFTAVRMSQLDIVKFLIEFGFAHLNIRNRKGQTPLTICTIYEDFATLKLLIENGADVNYLNGNGMSCLLIAISNGSSNLELLKFLVEKGSNLYIQNENGESLMKIARRLGNKKIVSYLKELSVK